MNDKLIEIIKKDYDFLSSLPVKDYILYRKWYEINSTPITDAEKQIIYQLKKSTFLPDDPYDYLKIEPRVIPVITKEQILLWTTIRKFHCSLVWNQNPGRHQKYIIQDKKTLNYLGVISLGSDFTGIGGRNEYIGWTKDQIMNQGMLNYTACGTSIVPLQPFGYNAVGGKLIALLTCSNDVIDFWNNKYKEPLVGITTTSLYGGYSQYNSLKYWKKVKSSAGQVELELSPPVLELVKKYAIENNKYTGGTRAKKHLLQLIRKDFGIKVNNNAPRGVYFCELFDNTKEFLRMETKDIGNKKFDNSVNALTELWKNKYANKRIDNVKNKLSTSLTFYDDVYGLTWEETRGLYGRVKEVGEGFG